MIINEINFTTQIEQNFQDYKFYEHKIWRDFIF